MSKVEIGLKIGKYVLWGNQFNPEKVFNDPAVNPLVRYRTSRTGRKGGNAAQYFSRFVHRTGKTLPIKLSTPTVRIRRKVKTSSLSMHEPLQLDGLFAGEVSLILLRRL